MGYTTLQDLALLYLSRCMGYQVAQQPPATLHSVPQAHHTHSASGSLHLQSLSYNGLPPDFHIFASSGLSQKVTCSQRSCLTNLYKEGPSPSHMIPSPPFIFFIAFITLVVETQYHLNS